MCAARGGIAVGEYAARLVKKAIVGSGGADNAGQLMKLIDALEEDDDVQTVWGNYEVPDEVMERL